MPRARSGSTKKPSRRPKGTGSLLIRRDVYGRDIWYAKWRVGDEQVKRRIGPNLDWSVAAGSGVLERPPEQGRSRYPVVDRSAQGGAPCGCLDVPGHRR
jgi:hypothetical protein